MNARNDDRLSRRADTIFRALLIALLALWLINPPGAPEPRSQGAREAQASVSVRQ